MNSTTKIIWTVLAMFLVLGVPVFAGGNGENSETDNLGWVLDESDDPILPGVDPFKVAGDIITAGSSTVFPLSERMAERFTEEGYSYNITIDSIGSGAGFERWAVSAETDISNASREIKDNERVAARNNGRDPVEFKVGIDALAVVVSSSNNFISGATIDELKQIFSTANRWSDVNSSWPSEEILRFIPGTDSGTFDYFVERVFKKDKEPLLGSGNLQMSEDDNVLVQGVIGSPYAVGFFGYAYYDENKDALKALDIEGVAPNKANVDNGSYPISRPLFLYTSASIVAQKPQVAAFIAFYLTYAGEEVESVGYFPVADSVMMESRNKWLEMAKGLY